MNYPQGPVGVPPVGTAAKKKGSGCLLAVGIVAGVLGLLFVCGALLAYRAYKSPEGQKAVQLMGVGMKAMTAPGAKEVKALGCTQALVSDMEDAVAAAALIGQDAGPRNVQRAFQTLVICQTKDVAGAPTCDAIAATYVAAAAPTAPFMASVRTLSGTQGCAALYDAHGTRASAGDPDPD